MIPCHARQTDLRAAMRTATVNVSFAVFPFVSAQKKPLLGISAPEQISSVFLRACEGVSGKHTVEHQDADQKRNAVQDEAHDVIADKYRSGGNHDIKNECGFGKIVCSVSSVEKCR